MAQWLTIRRASQQHKMFVFTIQRSWARTPVKSTFEYILRTKSYLNNSTTHPSPLPIQHGVCYKQLYIYVHRAYYMRTCCSTDLKKRFKALLNFHHRNSEIQIEFTSCELKVQQAHMNNYTLHTLQHNRVGAINFKT